MRRSPRLAPPLWTATLACWLLNTAALAALPPPVDREARSAAVVAEEDVSDAAVEGTVLDPPYQREMALILASHLFRAHHDADLDGLRDLAQAPPGASAINWPALTQSFRRQLRLLLPANDVTCMPDHSAPVLPVPDRRGVLRLPERFRCDLPCQRGSYAVHVTMGPTDPLVVPDPRPGPLLQLWLSTPTPPAAPGPLPALLAPLGPCASRAPAVLLLAPLWGAALLLLGESARRVRGRRASRLRRLWLRLRGAAAPPPAARNPYDDIPRDMLGRILQRAIVQLSVAAQMLAAVAVAALLAPLWWRVAPFACWGSGLCLLGLLGMLMMAAGLALWGVALLVRDALPTALRSLPLAAGVVGLCLALTALYPDLERPIHKPAHSLTLPLAGPSVVVANQADVLELVPLDAGGRACQHQCPEGVVRAPLAGEVVLVRDHQPEPPLGQRDGEAPDGNFVVLRSGDELWLLAHLAPGSVRVRGGQHLAAGDPIASVGRSGDTTGPVLRLARLRPPLLPSRREGMAAPLESGPLWLRSYRELGLFGASTVQDAPPSPGQRIAP